MSTMIQAQENGNASITQKGNVSSSLTWQTHKHTHRTHGEIQQNQ